MTATPLKTVGVPVILITGAEHRIVESVRPLGLCLGSRGVEGRRAQAGAELPRDRQQSLHIGAQRRAVLRKRRTNSEDERRDQTDSDGRRGNARGKRQARRAAHVTSRV